MYLQIRLLKPSKSSSHCPVNKGSRWARGWIPIQGLQTGEDFQQGREGHETCDSCRNPSSGNRTLFLRSLATILAFTLTVSGEMSIEALTHLPPARASLTSFPSQLHVAHHSFKLAPDRGLDSHLPRFQVACGCGSRNGRRRSCRCVSDA